ncbi:MAG: serine/threonine-protein kinase [Acidimicrobiales bacterium]
MALDHDRVAAALPTYEIGEEIGRGAWGVVLRGRHRHLDRPVAVKELPRAFGADPTVRHRFTVEARLLATLDHPHIVPVYDYVESDGICLLVMELLPGGTVWDRFTGEGVPAAGACGIAIATCSALHHAHERGILHRDIKPENLLFSGSGTLKVSDFGIAKVMGGAASMATRTGLVLGTPAYMAPEQVTGVDLTPATDVYAVGTVLYELLSGRLPFRDDGSALALLYQRAHEDPAPLVEVAPDLPPDLIEVTMRAIARDPADRYQTADEMGAALADAAAAAWGRDWVNVGGIKLLAAGAIAERITDPRLPRSVDATAPAGAADLRSPASVVDAGPSVRDGTEPEVAGLAVTPEDLVPVQAVVAAEADRPVAAATIADAPPSPTPPPAPPPAAAPPPSARPAPAATPAAAPAPPPSARPAPAALPAAAPRPRQPRPRLDRPRPSAPPVPPLPPPSRTSAPPEPSTGRGRTRLPGATPPPVPEAPARGLVGGPPRWFLAPSPWWWSSSPWSPSPGWSAGATRPSRRRRPRRAGRPRSSRRPSSPPASTTSLPPATGCGRRTGRARPCCASTGPPMPRRWPPCSPTRRAASPRPTTACG